MDQNGKDPSKSPTSPDDVGSIRWCKNSSTPCDSSQVTNVNIEHSPNTSRRTPNPEFIEYGSFSMDVNAFERELQEKRELKRLEQGPHVAVQLKSTPKRVIDEYSPPPDHIKLCIRTSTEQPDASINMSTDEVDHLPMQHSTRVISYERVCKKKSVREITITRNVSNTGNTHQSQTKQSSSHEQFDDSAYHSHGVRIAGGSTPTTISVMSSSNSSLLREFDDDDDDNGAAGGIGRCSGMAHYQQRAASEPPHFPSRSMDNIATDDNRIDVSMNVVYAGNRSASSQSEQHHHHDRHQWNLVSGVADGNQTSTGRRHLARELFHSSTVDSECSSPGWYNEYQAQSFQTDHQPHRMDFKRSNSQYDNHIRQIRGIRPIIFILFRVYFSWLSSSKVRMIKHLF